MARPESLLRAYGHFELVIGAIGLGISVLLPHLDYVSALVSSYSRDPANGQARFDLASLLLESRQRDDAVNEFRAAIRLMPDSIGAYNGLGLALAVQGKLDEAIDQFKRALAIDPGSPDARRNLAIALGQRRQLGKAP